MTTSKTNEQAFEWLIERALVGSTKEEREAAGQTASSLMPNSIIGAYPRIWIRSGLWICAGSGRSSKQLKKKN